MPACLFSLASLPLSIPITVHRFQASAVQKEASEKWARAVLQVFWNSGPVWKRDNQMGMPCREQWAELRCYILLLAVAGLHHLLPFMAWRTRWMRSRLQGAGFISRKCLEGKVMVPCIQILSRQSLLSSDFHSTAHFISSHRFRWCIYFLL